VRRSLPEARIVVGGHHATVLPQEYNADCFDAIVRGEGCAPFAAAVAAFAAGRRPEGLAGVLVPGEGFDRRAAEALPVYPDLATLPSPRRDLWDPRHYRCIWPSERHPDWATLFPPVAVVRSSFGCLMSCSFCVVPQLCGGRHLARPVEAVVDELSRIPTEHIYFCDDETFIDVGHARALAEAIKARGIAKRYFAWARSTTVNRHPEVFKLWRSIGLDAVFLGFEATTDAELASISKRSTVRDNEQAHAALREMGIAVQAGFMVQPSFTRADFDRLRDYIRAMPPAQVTLTVFTPSPRSAAWQQDRERFVSNHLALHDCMHPLTPTTVPLKEFYRRFAELSMLGASKNPLRARRSLVPPWDLARIWLAAGGYARALRRAWRDFPPEMWK
jgi:radical SAM superfamily enzyme YgiQ (UPF0313 family)